MDPSVVSAAMPVMPPRLFRVAVMVAFMVFSLVCLAVTHLVCHACQLVASFEGVNLATH